MRGQYDLLALVASRGVFDAVAGAAKRLQRAGAPGTRRKVLTSIRDIERPAGQVLPVLLRCSPFITGISFDIFQPPPRALDLVALEPTSLNRNLEAPWWVRDNLARAT